MHVSDVRAQSVNITPHPFIGKQRLRGTSKEATDKFSMRGHWWSSQLPLMCACLTEWRQGVGLSEKAMVLLSVLSVYNLRENTAV